MGGLTQGVLVVLLFIAIVLLWTYSKYQAGEYSWSAVEYMVGLLLLTLGNSIILTDKAAVFLSADIRFFLVAALMLGGGIFILHAGLTTGGKFKTGQ